MNITYSEDFEIIDEGIEDIDVYDIEVTGAHNFFANDILVHNSCYVTLKPLVEKFILPKAKREDGSIDMHKVMDAMDRIAEDKITPVINASCDALAKYTNSLKQLMNFKREALADRGVWCCHPDVTIDVNSQTMTMMQVWETATVELNESERIIDLSTHNLDTDTIAIQEDSLCRVYRRWYEGELISIEVGERQVLLTPEHLVLVLTASGQEWKPAGHLTIGDEVICTMESEKP